MKITTEIITAIDKAKNKVKKIEASYVSAEFRKDSAWLDAINDIINRTGLAVRDELEQID